MPIKKEVLQTLLPANREIDKWHSLVKELYPRYGLTPDKLHRIAAFTAQTGYESRDWTMLYENLNYSATALNRIFRKYFANAGVNPYNYHRQPEKIANRVYANRMGNGPEESGDGWKYRGRGIIQLTGKNNYQAFSSHLNRSLEQTVEYVASRTGSLESALWFWQQNGLNDLADNLDIRGMTLRINGGYNGYDARKQKYLFAMDVLTGDTEEYQINIDQVLKIGSHGETVRAVQEKLGLVEDGIFGPATFTAIMKYQKKHNLLVDGILGPITLKHILT